MTSCTQKAHMNNQPKRPSYDEVRSLLGSREGLIVHFSTSPSMHKEDAYYPHDLQTALTNPCCKTKGLSCSVVTPHDIFDGDSPFVPGYVGIILDPRSRRSIVSCSTHDGGDCRNLQTGMVEGELEHVDISADLLCETIDGRTGYNNWLVKDFTVLGILALPPFKVEVIGYHPHIGTTRGTSHTNIHQIAQEFPHSAIYSVRDNQYCLLHEDKIEQVAYNEIWTLVQT